MKSPIGLALLILCSAGLPAQDIVERPAIVIPKTADSATAGAEATAGAQATPDSAASDDELAPWRMTFNSSKTTLGQVRIVFLYQDVIVSGTVEDLGRSSQLLEWRIARETTGSGQAGGATAQKATHMARYFVPNAMDGLPIRYSGKKANVIAVQLHHAQTPGVTDNALGEPVSDDSTVYPCFDLVVQFDDGTKALTTQYPNTLASESLAEPVSVIKAAAERMQRELPDLVGMSVYAAGFTELYRPESTVDDMVNQDEARMVPPADVPLLAPLTVIAARYVDSAGVVIEVQLPSGDKALALTTMPQLFLPAITKRAPTFQERLIGLLLVEIPHKLTKKDVAAIKSGSIYRGMSLYALEYLMGFPDKETKSEGGSTQLIFRKTLLVTLGYSGTVAEWKFLE